MDATLQNFITDAARQARVLRAAFALSQELSTLYSGVPAYGGKITQELIDSVPAFAEAGLTKGQLDGVLYSMAQINAQMTSYLTEFVVLSRL